MRPHDRIDAIIGEAELQQCKNSLDFWQYVAAILAAAIMLLSAMLYFCKSAHAGGFVEIGQANYKTPPNTLWWQDVDGYAINKDMTDSYFRLGYEFPINRNIGYRLSAFSLGKYSLWAEVNKDEPCIIKYGRDAKPHCGPSEAVETRGSVKGLALSLMARSSGTFRVFGEVGYTYNWQTFGLFQCIHDCFDVKNTYNETIHGGGKMVNVGVEYHNLTASMFFYRTNIGNWVGATTPGGPYPTGTGDVYGLSVGYRF